MTSSRRSIIALAAAACCLFVPALVAGQAAAAPAAPDCRSICFVDRTHGWVAGIYDDDSRVWRTTDGGQTWDSVGSQIAAGAGMSWVSFVSPTTGVWGYGSLVRTVDGGDEWSPTVTVGGMYNEAAFAGELRGWAVWSNGSSESGGGVARTDDGGATWTAQLDRPGPDGSGGFSRVSAPTAQRCYAFKWGRRTGVYATADAGATWTRRALPAFSARYRYYQDIDFPGARVGWAVGDSGRIVEDVQRRRPLDRTDVGLHRAAVGGRLRRRAGRLRGRRRRARAQDHGRRPALAAPAHGHDQGAAGGELRRPHPRLGGGQGRRAAEDGGRRPDLDAPALGRQAPQSGCPAPGRRAYMRWTKGTKPRRS